MSDSSSILSDSISEQEIFDHSLSMWREKRPSSATDEFCFKMEDDFEPLELDIHTQCCVGDYQGVKNAVKNGSIELNGKNKGGWTPLMYACYTGHEAIVSLLIEAGVDLNMSNNYFMTPLMLACSCGNEAIVKLLIELGAHKNAVDCKGWSALFHATFSGQQVVVKHLLECGVDMDLRDHSTGMTALMEAAQAGHEAIVMCFLDKGVDTKVKSNNGNTALTYAMLKVHSNIVQAIQHYNRKIEISKSKMQESPKSILKHTNSLLEGPEAVKKLMKKLAFKDEVNLVQNFPKMQQPSSKPSPSTPAASPHNQNTILLSAKHITTTHDTTPTLQQLLQQLGLNKYYPIFQEQDVDIAIFLTLNDNDLKEIGINLLGPRKKMLMAINRWHSNHKSNTDKNDQKINMTKNAFPVEQEMKELVFSLDSKVQDMERELKKAYQNKELMENKVLQYHKLLMNIGKAVKAHKINCEAVIEDMKDYMQNLNYQSNDVVCSTSQSLPISHLIGQELANQMLDDKTNQSSNFFLFLKKSCDALEATNKTLFEEMSSFFMLSNVL